MNKTVFYIIIVLLSFSTVAQQNLVPNPSFEEYSSCPLSTGANGLTEIEDIIYDWYRPNYATTDYYNTCAQHTSGSSVPSNWLGYQNAFEGNAYVGLIVYDEADSLVSEYIQCKLSEALKACHVYHISFYISLSDYSQRATNILGLRVDKNPISQLIPSAYQYYGFNLPPHISSNYVITDTINWTKISGDYTAKGGEQYLTIGRFIDTSIYHDVVPNIINDCDSCMNFGIPCQYYIDYVSVIESESNIEQSSSLPNILTANNDDLNDYWYPNEICFNKWKCDILNRWGNTIFTFSEGEVGWGGTDKFGSKLNEGTYFYKIYNNEQELTGFIQLVR